jgi:polysaccharide biosynthesis/export protein
MRALLSKFLLLLFCVGTAFAQTPAAGPNAAPSALAPKPVAAVPTSIAASQDYRLGAGDVARITVYQSPDLTLEARISEAGVISYPLLGAVRLGGLTSTEAEKLIADGLRSGSFLKQPQVSVLVLQVRGNQASVLGQVNRPGRYPIESTETRLSDLLATAGGVAPSGADAVTIVGVRNGKPFRTELDLQVLFGPERATLDILVQNGDVLWVERSPVVYIYGEVQRPGAMRLERGMSVMQALATGGGLSLRGTEKGLRVHRKGADGKTAVLSPALDDVLRDGDVVFVRESLF